ncbi:MAG: hypothetical protein AB7O38_28665, partial [Pirellulaceae bacterium]
MRKLYEALLRQLDEFRSQRDDLLLLVPSGDHDVALLLKALRDLDRDAPSDLFLLFQDDFTSPDAYVTALARRLHDEVTLTNESTGAGEEKLPPVPAAMFEADRPAWARLEIGFQYARALIEPRRGQHFVWGMCPLQIRDPAGLAELLARLPPRDEIASWMRGARLVVRLPADFQLDSSPLAKAQRVAVKPFLIPPDAHETELHTTAADPALPAGDRMQAEIQLAYLDVAHSRFDEATRRFRKALAFFQWAGVPAMEGLIINGLGDIASRQQNWRQARHWYACAVVPAAETGNPMLLGTIVHNLAVVSTQQQDWASAEERYGELADIKRGMFDEVGLAESLEWQGISQEKQGAYDRAVLSW